MYIPSAQSLTNSNSQLEGKKWNVPTRLRKLEKGKTSHSESITPTGTDSLKQHTKVHTIECKHGGECPHSNLISIKDAQEREKNNKALGVVSETKSLGVGSRIKKFIKGKSGR